ncbi:uncharacterized protein Dana_GF26489 [Drosophila ananassae]|uniref:Uncharacterized protein n=1 Tax=Drosophila ananassae TaxID=7217 RepID=A0A0P9AX80_DROAN|nr:collagen alpha-1(I) chain [Drosophila ananassae]KPU81694.1 uncharacterized protein Dana_GF26489 [Drosophila ananassae]
MGRPAAPGDKEGPPGDSPGGQRSEGDPGGQSKNGEGGPPAQFGAADEAKETEEEPGEKGGGRNPSTGKGQRKVGRGNGQGGGSSMEGGGSCWACRNAPKSGAPEMPAKQGHAAGPLGQEGGARRKDKEDDGATGVAKPKVAAREATHPAPAGAEGGGGRGGAVDARSMGVASPDGEAEAGEADFLPGEEAS